MRLQSIIFPTEEKHQACRKLFYRGDHGIINTSERSLSMGYAQHFDFATYLNACSWQKIQNYSKAKSLTLTLEFQGKIRVTFVGYTKKALVVTKKVFSEREYSSKDRKSISYTFPDNAEHSIGFEITALEKSTFYGGNFSVDIAKEDTQKVVLSLATTTCHKEEFIKKNVNLIKKEILSPEDKDPFSLEVAKNLYLHVVDNGRTLRKKEIKGPHIFLHPNPNVGGSGGYARGMIESLGQSPAATHVLLMDDDVLVLPESIKRTYTLLRILKPEFRDNLISGAMLYYENPSRQHEDIGTIVPSTKGWDWRPLKKPMNQERLTNNLDNEYNYPLVADSYAAWWYCCIPTALIKEHGLPLPIFIRCDDIEYGIRCNTGIITLNGICIWHMGAATKYNAAFDIYQCERNMMIAQACSGKLQKYDTIRSIRSAFRREIIQFSYDGAEMALRALEDYMRGPHFLEEPRGEEILKRNIALNDKLIPLSEIAGGESVNKLDAFLDPDFTILDRFIAKYTWNGHRFCPKFLEDSCPAAIGFDFSVQLHRIILKNKLIAINPYESTGILRMKDRARFQKLYQRYKYDLRYYKEHSAEIAASYRAAYPYFTSEKFWRKYLGIDKKT